ncbi:hypothetical protein IZY60_15150 [Lutibacter sp. B2]|nr:hypothetical protein [Lutibacter sp. B2]
MYKLVAQIIDKRKIVGYQLMGSTGSLKEIRKEDVIRFESDIINCYLNNNGYLSLKEGLMSEVTKIPLSSFKSKNTPKKPYTIYVKSRDTYITTASKGDQSKWKVGNKWVKADTQGFEGLAEEFTSLFLSCIQNIGYVPYHTCYIKKDNKEILRGCYSEDMFKNENEIFVTIHKLYEQHGLIFEDTLKGKPTKDRIIETIKYIKKYYNVDITKYLVEILYIDKLIWNEDRHPSNLGLIKNIETGKYRVTPIFDNGLAFLARANHWGNLLLHVAERNRKYEPFGNKQVSTLVKMYKHKLVIDKALLDKKIEGYKNPLYQSQIVEQTKRILFKNLKLQEGKLWERK